MNLKSILRKFVPQSVINVYHLVGAVLAAVIYGFPGRQLRVFAVTGTNGKTTTSLLLFAILRAARRKVGLTSTVRFSNGGELTRNDTKLGTQNPFALQRLLRQMVRNGVTEAVIEVTSIGLDQYRIWGIPIDTAIVTNLTPDHLEYHASKVEYRRAKERLFASQHRVSVVNGDDASAKYFLAYPAVRRVIFSTRSNHDSSQVSPVLIWVSRMKQSAKGTKFTLQHGRESVPVSLRLIGQFNVENALAAAAAAIGANIPLEIIAEGLQALDVSPGRMELLNYGQLYSVVLDYAHTPDALKKVFETVKPLVKGRIIHVGGATGRRYREKRALLGALAGRYADVVIVTDEDPYDEHPSAIIAEVVAGVKKGAGRRRLEQGVNFLTVLDRAQAIRTALKLATPTDLVLITGKGDETVMAVGHQLVPFSDRDVVATALGGETE